MRECVELQNKLLRSLRDILGLFSTLASGNGENKSRKREIHQKVFFLAVVSFLFKKERKNFDSNPSSIHPYLSHPSLSRMKMYFSPSQVDEKWRKEPFPMFLLELNFSIFSRERKEMEFFLFTHTCHLM